MATRFYRKATDRGDFLVRAGDGLSALVYASESAWRARCGATNALEWTDPAKAAAFFADAVETGEPERDPLPEPDPEADARVFLATSDSAMARAAEDAVLWGVEFAKALRAAGIALPEDVGVPAPELRTRLDERAVARAVVAAAVAARAAAGGAK